MKSMIHDFFFGSKVPPKKYRVDKDNKRDPEVGDIYKLQSINPFADPVEAHVFEIRDGWVRYSFWPKDDKYAVQSESIGSFLRIFDLLVEETENEQSTTTD
jgi:hypothetical protein